MNEPINKDLSARQIAKISNSDTSFIDTFETIDSIKKRINYSTIELTKYSDLDYARIHHFLKIMRDTTYFSHEKDSLKDCWKRLYGKDVAKADSLLCLWRDYVDHGTLHNYIHFSMDSLITVNDENNNRKLYFLISVKPLKASITSVDFRVNFSLENDNGAFAFAKHSLQFSLETFDSSTMKWYFPISDKVAGDFLFKSMKEIKDMYHIGFEVTYVTIAGKILESNYPNIPISLQNLWFRTKESSSYAKYKKEFIIDQVNKHYIDMNEFIDNGYIKVLKNYDFLAYDFLSVN
jgi:hypothetical protein